VRRVLYCKMIKIKDRQFNPLTISRVKWTRGKRRGYHPLFAKMYDRATFCEKMKVPKFRWHNNFRLGWWKPASVEVFGLGGFTNINGSCYIHRIECRSNDAAKKLKRQIESDLTLALNKCKSVH